MSYTEQEKEIILKKAYDLAYKYEQEYSICSQCVLASIQDIFGLEESVFKSGHGLGGGISRTTRGTCGGLAAGVMVIGSRFGRDIDKLEHRELFEDCFTLSKKLFDRFIEEYSSCICSEVHKKVFGRTYNMFDPEDKKAFINDGGHRDKCPAVVGNVAKWTTDILLKEGIKVL